MAIAKEVIPFVDLRAQYRTIESEIQSKLHEVISTSQFILGPGVEAFERQFAKYIGSRFCVGVGNGLDALRLALMAVGLGPGDEVIVPANTFIATALAVSSVSAHPVLVDCDPETYNIDPTLIQHAITGRTKAIIPVDFAGQPADYERLTEVAQGHGLLVIEDAAQAHGARYRGRFCGSLATLGCFSFYPGKNLGAYGDGGAVTTDDPVLAARIRQLRSYGERVKYEHVIKGTNSRLDALQAGVLAVKLGYLERWNEARRANAALYHELLAGVGDIQFQRRLADADHAYHLFIVTSAKRDELRNHLAANGIQTGVHYPIPIHLQVAYADLGHRVGDFPHAEWLASSMLSLPMYPELSVQQIQRVADAVREFFS